MTFFNFVRSLATDQAKNNCLLWAGRPVRSNSPNRLLLILRSRLPHK
jgi:hypothetical protein